MHGYRLPSNSYLPGLPSVDRSLSPKQFIRAACVAFASLLVCQHGLIAQALKTDAANGFVASQADANSSGAAVPSALMTVASQSSSSNDLYTEPFSWPDDDDADGGQAPPKDAAAKQTAKDVAASDRSPQTKRILGIIPNYRAVSTDEKLPPQTVKEKFMTATEDSFDYSSIVIPALLAGYDLGTNATPEFGHGAVGYGRYLWHAAVDQTSENYMVEFIVPALTREDTRYYTKARGTFWKRASYSVSRVVITRSDSGHEVFNMSEVVGAGASSGLSTLYYPSRERSFGNTGKQWGLDLGIDAAADVVKEFWPDINHWLFHGVKPNTAPQN